MTQRRLRDALWIAMAYVGAVIGAGFASGREIVNFFTIHGENSYQGIFVATALFIVTGLIIIITSYLCKARNYIELFVAVSTDKLGKWFAAIVTVFLYMGLAIMVSASATLLRDIASCPLFLGALLTALFVSVVLLFGITGILKVNGLLVPMLIAATIWVRFCASTCHGSSISIANQPGTIVHALLYVCFNSIIISVLITSLITTFDIKAILLGVFLGALSLGILLYILNSLLLPALANVVEAEMPMLSIIEGSSHDIYLIYALILWVAFITTALTNAQGIMQTIADSSAGKVFSLVLSTVPLSCLGFRRLVGIVYPLLGYLALFFIVALCVWPFRRTVFVSLE